MIKTFNQHINETYEFELDNIDGDGKTIEYKLSFDGKNSRYFVTVTAYLKQKLLRIDFSDDDGSNQATGIAGMDAVRVFKTLRKILVTGLESHPDFGIMFEGDPKEPSKIKLYRALAEKTRSELGGRLLETKVRNNIRFTISRNSTPNR